jgi:hypothetical protein
MRGRRTTSWLSRHETVVGVGLALGFLLLAVVSFAVFRQAGTAWAAAHDHGTHGTWTAMRRDHGGKSMVNWYGDFVPDDGGPTRHDAPLMSHATRRHRC